MITHINGVSLIGETSTDKMLSLISKGRRKPISMTVTKCFNAKLERLYPPIVPLLKSVGLDVDEIYRLPFASVSTLDPHKGPFLYRRNYLTKRGAKHKLSQTTDAEDYNPLDDSDDEDNAKLRTGHSCLYIGSVNVGNSGDFDRIEFGINRVLSVLPPTSGQVTFLQLTDMELRLLPHNSDEVILRSCEKETISMQFVFILHFFQDMCILKLRAAGDLFTNLAISALSRSPGSGPSCASVTCSTHRAPPRWLTSSPASRTDSAGPTSPCRRTSPCSECI